MSFIIVFSCLSPLARRLGFCCPFYCQFSQLVIPHPSPKPQIYAGVAAADGVAAEAPLRPRGSSSESSSLGGRLSSWRRFLRLLVICLLSASWHFKITDK